MCLCVDDAEGKILAVCLSVNVKQITAVSSHHTDLSLFAGAGGADEHLQLDSELLVLSEDLVKLLHEVLGLSGVWQVLCRHRHQLE